MDVTDRTPEERPTNSAKRDRFRAAQGGSATGETPATLTNGGQR